MKDSTKLWLSCAPFILIGAAFLLSPMIGDFIAQRREAAWKKDPLTMQITVSKPTEASSPLRTDTGGDMQVFEIGLLRLAMPAKGVRGAGASSGNRIATTSTASGGGSAGSSRGHRHAHNDIAYGSQHQFTGPGYDYKLDIKQGCLCVGDQRICIVDTPKLVLLESTGEIKSVTEISVSFPPLKGSPADVAALVALSQKYARTPRSEFGEEQWRLDPLTTKLEVNSPGEAESASQWMGFKEHIVFENAMLRLVIPAGNPGITSRQISGKIATHQSSDGIGNGTTGRHGTAASDPHAHGNWLAGGSAHHVFSGPGYKFTFDIIQGCLCIQGRRVCIVDTPKLVILDRTGHIKSVEELKVIYKKLIGKPEDIRSLVKMAKEFAAPTPPPIPPAH